MSTCLVLLLGISLVVLSGCEKKVDTTTDLTKEQYDAMTAEDLLARIKDKENVTKEEYVDLINTYEFVTIKDDFTLEDNITNEAIKSIDSKAKPSLDEYLPDILNSKSAQVRGYGISLITSLFGVSDANLELAKNLIKTETEPYVLYKATDALSNELKDNDVKDFVFKMAENENALIRKKAAYAIANSWSKDVEGAVDKIIALMKDSDVEVRKAAASGSGKLNDEAVIDPLVEILNNAEDSDVHASAIEGLCHLWYDYPFFENTSEKAYNATMDYYKKTPRTDKVPAWNSLSAFRTTSTQDAFSEWKTKATYYDTEEIYNIMVELIKDGDMNWLGRTSAMDVVKNHCGDEKLSGLREIVDGLTDSKASLVKSSYDSKVK